MRRPVVQCLCTGRKDIVCTETSCSIAGPGSAGDPNQCRVCFYLGKRPTSINGVGKGVSRCASLGEDTGERVACSSCSRSSLQKVFACSKHELCTMDRAVPGVQCCKTCNDFSPVQAVTTVEPDVAPNEGVLTWSYGVMTVHSRLDSYLPPTLRSLKAGGFDRPRLFGDGVYDAKELAKASGLDVTARGGDPVRCAGNWLLSMAELYYRNPWADRYALFQDDFVTLKNLRQFLELSPFPQKGYLNLFTFPSNEMGKAGWYEARTLRKDTTDQTGRGAVALVFNQEGVQALLSAPTLVQRAIRIDRGHYAIDGGVVVAMNNAGFREYVHSPSLTQHRGQDSSIGNLPHRQSTTFPGENYDALNLLKLVGV